jgi:folate-binding protein YgfZ
MSSVDSFRTHLEAVGGQFSQAILAHWGDAEGERAALAGGVTLHACWGDGLLRASGADAQAFLQSQLSNDIRELDSARAQLTTWCTPQGRVLAILLAWREHDDYLLQIPHELVEPVRQRLQRFVLRSRVTLAEASAERIVIGIGGAGAHDTLAAVFTAVPSQPMHIAEAGSGVHVTMIRPQLYQVAVPRVEAARVWDVLAQRACPGTAAGWHWRRIHSCLPVVTVATQDRFVPQMLDLERIGAVSFSKGCYPGQEIVARSQYRGEVKRRLFRVHADIDAMTAGQDVLAQGAPAGAIVNAAPAPTGGWDALAVLQVEAAERGSLELAGSDAAVRVAAACH